MLPKLEDNCNVDFEKKEKEWRGRDWKREGEQKKFIHSHCLIINYCY